MKLARRVSEVQPSPTLALNAKARALRAEGVDVLGLAAGEPDFDTPDFVKAAAIQAIREGFTRYTASPGMPELRATIADHTKDDLGLEVASEQVLVTSGAKQALYNLFQALLNDGDEVVILSPYWVSYPEMVRLAGGVPVVVETRFEDGWAPDPAKLREVIGPKTRAVVVNSPGNPTGATLGEAALRGIAEAVEPHPDCLVVTDDIYRHLLYTEAPFKNVLHVAPELADRTVIVDGVSKSFAMTGWRLGWAVGPKALIKAMQMVQDQSTSNASSISQRAALAALRGPSDTVAPMVTEYRRRRALFGEGLAGLPGFELHQPDGAFYMFPSVRKLLGRSYEGRALESSMALSEVLLEKLQIAAVPGEPFGAPGFLRMSFVTSDEVLNKALERLTAFVGALE